MDEREALLRAVAAHPDEDTPRLMYADLLDELGGGANTARARFIRIQIDLARNPGRSWFANADRLSEVARLAGQFADVWLAELPKWAADEARKQKLRADDFPRGFLSAFRVSAGTFVAQGDQLLGLAPVTHVIVTGQPLKRPGMRSLLGAPHLNRVRALALPGCDGQLTADLMASSPALGSLEELDLSNSGLTDAGAALLARPVDLGRLRVLTAWRSSLTGAGAETLLSSPWLPNLRTLDLRGAPDGYRWAREIRSRCAKKSLLV